MPIKRKALTGIMPILGAVHLRPNLYRRSCYVRYGV